MKIVPMYQGYCAGYDCSQFSENIRLDEREARKEASEMLDKCCGDLCEEDISCTYKVKTVMVEINPKYEGVR